MMAIKNIDNVDATDRSIATMIDLYNDELLHANVYVRQFIIDNYHNIYQFLEMIACMSILIIGSYLIYNISDHYIIVSNSFVQISITIFIILITSGVTFGSFRLISKMVDRLEQLTAERDELEDQMSDLMDENTMLKNKLIEYEHCIQKYNHKRISSSSDEDFSKFEIEIEDDDDDDDKMDLC
jgi:hypothetical protein